MRARALITWSVYRFFNSLLLKSRVRGVSFQIQDDDEILKVSIDKEVEEIPQLQVTPVKEEHKEAALSPLSPLAQPALSHESSTERIQLPVTIHSIIAETTNDVRNVEITQLILFCY